MTPTDFQLESRMQNWERPDMAGFAAANAAATNMHDRKVKEAGRLYADVLRGRLDPVFMREAMRPRNATLVQFLQEKYPGLYGDPGGRNLLGLRETMGVTDYQALFIDVLDRLYYGFYSAYPIVNKGLVRVHTLRDFRLVKRYLLDDMVTPYTSSDPGAPATQSALLGPTPQNGANPPTPATSTAALTYSPLLYQAGASVNWAAFVNDDLGIFKDLSSRLGIKASRGISKFITGFYVDANGPHASLYSSGYGNIINIANGAASNNPRLSAQGLSDALKILAGMKDSTGDPILVTGRLKLVYGPGDVAIANNLMHMLEVYLTTEGGNAGTAQPAQFVRTTNWLTQNMDMVMDPYIPIVVTTVAAKNSWCIFVDPASQERPAIEIGFLQGFETPQLFSKVPNTQRMGGGVDPTMGDFFSQNQDIKIVGVMGGTQIDGRTTVGSNGSNS
jgi:hypothetical protein